MNDYIKDMRTRIGHDRLILVGAGVYVTRNGKVLLQKRRDNGAWAEHGGCTEIGEAVEDTARRELLEETGLIANNLELIGVFSGEDTLYTYPNGDKVYFVSISYLCDDYTGIPVSNVNETTELCWFDLDNLPENISPPSRKSMEAFVKMAYEKYGSSLKGSIE